MSVAFGGAESNPAATLAAERLTTESTRAALAALDVLEAALEPALDHARAAVALMVEGGDAPGARLLSAAEAAEAARDEARVAAAALAELNSARRAADPSAPALPDAVDAPSLDAITEELRDAADAADVFARMMGRTRALLEHLESALAAIVRGGVDDGRAELTAARADHDALASWALATDPLAVWLATTDAMIHAVKARIDAVEAEDDEAEEAAVALFTQLSEQAGAADRALRIAISEGAAAVTNPVIERLGAAMASVQEARAAVNAAFSGP